MHAKYNSRARSIKTRIETTEYKGKKYFVYEIREQDPLKQGLKLDRDMWVGDFQRIREQDPLKQGLKPK